VQVSSEGGQVTYPGFSVYHASKWGIEGFVEAVAQEVSGFGIDFILAEPGPTETRFSAGIDLAEPLLEYARTPAGEVRHAVKSHAFPLTGDAKRTIDALLCVIDMPHPPLRLALGSTAYNHIHPALTERLRVLEQYKQQAYSCDKLDA
jgi:short-subunit dehydrogenase